MKYDIKSIATNYNGIRFRSRLEATWAVFFDLMGWDWDYEPIDLNGWTPDFVLKNGEVPIYVEVKPIHHLSELENKGKYIRERIGETFVSNCLLLGISPTIIGHNYYENYRSLQIGWIYSIGEACWESVVLRANNGISNTLFFVYDLLQKNEDWRAFASDEHIDEVIGLWAKAKNETQFLK